MIIITWCARYYLAIICALIQKLGNNAITMSLTISKHIGTLDLSRHWAPHISLKSVLQVVATVVPAEHQKDKSMCTYRKSLGLEHHKRIYTLNHNHCHMHLSLLSMNLHWYCAVLSQNLNKLIEWAFGGDNTNKQKCTHVRT